MFVKLCSAMCQMWPGQNARNSLFRSLLDDLELRTFDSSWAKNKLKGRHAAMLQLNAYELCH